MEGRRPSARQQRHAIKLLMNFAQFRLSQHKIVRWQLFNCTATAVPVLLYYSSTSTLLMGAARGFLAVVHWFIKTWLTVLGLNATWHISALLGTASAGTMQAPAVCQRSWGDCLWHTGASCSGGCIMHWWVYHAQAL